MSASEYLKSLKSVSEMELPNITELKVQVICASECESLFPCSVNVGRMAELRGCAGHRRSGESGMRGRSEEVVERFSGDWLTRGVCSSKWGGEGTGRTGMTGVAGVAGVAGMTGMAGVAGVVGMALESWMDRFPMSCSTAWRLT